MLKNFVENEKTKIIFGKDVHLQAGKEIACISKKCLLVNDGNAFLLPLVNQVKNNLEENGIAVYEANKVQPNPLLSYVIECADLCKKEDIGFVLSIGGGSSMDSGKVISLAAFYDGDIFKFDASKPITHKIIPHGCISTLAGTGSEVSFGAIMIDDTKQPNIKLGYGHPDLRNDIAFINPELMYTLPPKMTGAGAVDTVSHAMEHYFNNSEDSFLADGYLETVIKTAMACSIRCINNPKDYNARANLCMCAIMANSPHMSIDCVGSDWCVHNLEKPIATFYHGTHGIIIGILTLQWIKVASRNNPKKFIQWANNCLGIVDDDFDSLIQKCYDKYNKWLLDLGLPTKLSEIGVDDSRFEEAADIAIKDIIVPVGEDVSVDGETTLGFYSKLTKDQIIEIYKEAL